MVDFEKSTIISKLQTMPENEVTKKVIIPLLQSLGFYKVEFFGGIDENGKDILCWDKNRFGEVTLTVAQVKHFKFTKKASDTKSLQTIVNQLVACFKDSLLNTDQGSYLPTEAILITTYIVDTKTLQSRFNHPNLIDKRIRIIDGLELSTLLLANAPSIAKELLGIELEISSVLKESLTNEILLTALGFNEKKDLRNIYTDIDFSLGKLTTKLFFTASYSPVVTKLLLDEKDWTKFKDLHELYKDEFPLFFINSTIGQIESNYERMQYAVTAWRNDLRDHNKYHSYLSKQSERAKKAAKDSKTSTLQDKYTGIFNKFYDEMLRQSKVIERFKAKPPANPIYSFEISGPKLVDMLLEQRSWIERKVEQFNSKKPSLEEVSVFIKTSKKIIESASHFFQGDFFSCTGFQECNVVRQDFDSTRFKLPIHYVFDTGQNISVLGEAGAGKTTSLQMYALESLQTHSRLTVYVSLSTLMQNWVAADPSLSDAARIEKFTEGITTYLSFKGISISPIQFHIELSTKKWVVLLDGIDEAITYHPWLPQAISRMAELYAATVQIIVSSRASGSYIDQIPFFTVTLLPFTTEQRNEFITNWFKDHDSFKVERIQHHLIQNSELSEIIKNPLLTTTICVLAEKDIDLPTSEILLYESRLKLLTGFYDSAKKIDKRAITPQHLLEQVAQKLAYYLHSKGKREESVERLVKEVAILPHFNPSDAETAVKELIDPCNILIPMTEDGKYGFGHLRYQEHLTAKEIMSNRSITVIHHLKKPWWRAVFLLFAKMNTDLIWLVEDVANRGNLYEFDQILYEMIDVAPIRNKRLVMDEFQYYLDMDTLNNEDKDDYVEPDDDDDDDDY